MGEKSPPTQRASFMKISKGSEIQKCFSSATWIGAPSWWHSAPLWANRCELSRRQSSKELWPGLRAISLSSTCRQRERRHWAAEHTSILPCFSQNDSSTENVNLCLPKHQSQEGCEKKQVSSALEKVHDKHFPIISNSIWFLKRGRKLKISQHMWQPVLLQKCVWPHFQLCFIATPKDEKQTCVCVCVCVCVI